MQNELLTFSDTVKHRVKMAIYILLAIAVLGIIYHIFEYIHLKFSTKHQNILPVAVTIAKPEQPVSEIVLPGNVQAWHEATIFARTNGYVITWLVDIGAQVKQGQLLATISAPEVVAQLQQTEANLITAEANYKLAKSTAERWQMLLKTDSVSKQETDEKVSAYQAAASIVNSTRATRDRLRDLVSFQRVIAPFDGVIMSRTTDIGRLINAGSGTVPLFRIVQSNPLRIYVRVPQYFSKYIDKDTLATLYFTERPGKKYPAKLLDTAKAIDTTTRTLLTQFEVNNNNGELFAGSYTQVHLAIPVNKNHIVLPVNAVIFDAKGLQVAVIDGDSKAYFKHIMVGRDFGNSIEVVWGLTKGEQVILNPPDSLLSGQKVNIVSSDGEKEKQKA